MRVDFVEDLQSFCAKILRDRREKLENFAQNLSIKLRAASISSTNFMLMRTLEISGVTEENLHRARRFCRRSAKFLREILRDRREKLQNFRPKPVEKISFCIDLTNKLHAE